MADHSSIEWTDATWNPITGCSIVSPGCTNCYAMRLAGTRLRHIDSRKGLTRDTKAGPVWTGEVRLNRQWLNQPIEWKKPRRIFVCAHGDLFAENVPDEWIISVVAVSCAGYLLRGHTLQVLTKRSARMRALLNSEQFWDAVNEQVRDLVQDTYDPLTIDDFGPDNPCPGIWLGVSAEDQMRADERVPDLLATPAAVRFVSAEPLLGPIDFRFLQPGDPPVEIDALNGTHGVLRPHGGRSARLDWIIAGGESGQNARPMHPAWARSIRDQCADAGVPFFFKQWGAWAPRFASDVSFITGSSAAPAVAWPDGTITATGRAEDHGGNGSLIDKVGKKAAGRLLDGVEHSEFPKVAA